MSIIRQPGKGAETCHADRNKIFQILLNLVNNAIKASRPDGKIFLKTELIYAGKFIRISVIDKGAGIPETEIKRIFDEFYSVRKQRKKKSGTGLGLSIVRHIVHIHKGKIHVESEPDKGTAFYVDLPK